MKKVLAICLVLILSFVLVGCNNDNVDDNNVNPPVSENQGNENQENDLPNEDEGSIENGESDENETVVDESRVDGKMTKLMEKAEIQVNAPMQDVIPADMSETYIGLTSGDFETYVVDSVFYESMISPANQSFCLIEVNDETKVEELKQKIFDNCNPRKWICMSAERVVVMNSGNYIMLAMASKDSCDALIPAFSAYFDGNVGETLDKMFEENIEFEDNGMAL